MSLNLNALKSSKSAHLKKFKTYSVSADLSSISNDSVFKKFMVKQHESDLNITVVPQRSHMYQGVDFEFDFTKPKEDYAKDFYDY